MTEIYYLPSKGVHMVLLEDYRALEARKGSLVPLIIETFRKARGGPAPVDPEFWKAMALAGAKEIADATDWGHLLKELADLTFISIDGIAALGGDPETVIRNRLEENGKKDLSKRDTDYYRRRSRSP